MRPFHLPDSPRYLIAFSGGADSRLLLELTVRTLSARLATKGIWVGDVVEAAHLNHGIRGDEADRDEAFCRRVCAAMKIPLTVERVSVPDLAAASGRSLEAEAREARYAFFARLMREKSIPTLLTAHNADDNLETLLYHLVRGTGTKGLGGIPPSRLLETVDGVPYRVCRPLLGWSRRTILRQCEQFGIEFVTDSTNLTDTCTRNRLRHGVIPPLEQVAGEESLRRAATRLAQAAREDEEALMTLAAARYEAVITPPSPAAPDGSLPLAALQNEMPALAKRMLLLAYKHAVGEDALSPDRTLSAYHLEDLLTLCRDGRDGDVSDCLPGGGHARIRKGALVFCPASDEAANRPTAATNPVPLPPRALSPGLHLWDEGDGTAESPALYLLIEVGDALPAPACSCGADVLTTACFPTTVLPLYAKYREAGDMIHSHGMSKRVKKLLCDHHVAAPLRDRLPLLCRGEEASLLWVPGVAFGDGYPAPASGEDTVRVTVFLGEPRLPREQTPVDPHTV